MRVSLLRDNWKPVTIYAFAGTLASTFVVGFLVSWLLKIPILTALVFGALISPTDPISVISIFKQLGVGKRLSLMIECYSQPIMSSNGRRQLSKS
jgi:CPA1 family monovalent cation:H+ antiporter